ncbi:MAG: hypothetical protein RMM58_13045 [Chloroflexota bacterium]|nr:hypothetical protein [Dehalococcoidia bacterium]MDW8254797.1 hypothetical protein [Chloroflexota bacterium]
MNSSVIGKIEKARRYAQERNRIHFTSLSATFHGENADHTVTLENGRWHCSCHFFKGWNFCSHTMAFERVLEGMLPATARAQGLDFGEPPAASL